MKKGQTLKQKTKLKYTCNSKEQCIIYYTEKMTTSNHVLWLNPTELRALTMMNYFYIHI